MDQDFKTSCQLQFPRVLAQRNPSPMEWKPSSSLGARWTKGTWMTKNLSSCYTALGTWGSNLTKCTKQMNRTWTWRLLWRQGLLATTWSPRITSWEMSTLVTKCSTFSRIGSRANCKRSVLSAHMFHRGMWSCLALVPNCHRLESHTSSRLESLFPAARGLIVAETLVLTNLIFWRLTWT